MKRAITAWTFRENWPLVLVFTLAVLGAGAGLYKGLDGDETMAAADPVELLNPNTVMSEEEMRAVLFAPPAPQPPTVAEQNMGALAGHRARYDAIPDDPDAEALLRAMANLYRQTGDFENAAWAYGQFLKRFPQNPHRTAVCMGLAACFEQLGEADNLTRLYLGMLKDYPPGSNEYNLAEASLKMSDLPLRQRNPMSRESSGPEGTFTVKTLPDGTVQYLESPSPESAGVSEVLGKPAS